VIGAGRVGTALAVLLQRAGHRIVAASGREASRERVDRYLPETRFLPPADAARDAAVVLITVPDDAIASVCRDLAGAEALRPGRTVVHVSGSVGLDALDAASAAGASVLSMHPLQSFPDVNEGIARLPGSGIAVTARAEDVAALGDSLARDVGGIPFRLADEVKPLYHAAAVFGANYLVAVEGIAERLLRLAGVDQPLPLLQALARTSFDRTFEMGPAAALTGPVLRADTGTIRRNLQALQAKAPFAVPAYVELARAALRIAQQAGRVRSPAVESVEETLSEWR
jgi:predicted short-subunit dehydrogenase-like oxidoreductase (DUF2520 family)